MPDLLIRAFHPELRVGLVAAIGTDVCQEAALRHDATAAAACALGRGILAGCLLAGLAGSQRVTIQLQSNGPLKGLTVDAHDDGTVRGYPLAKAACPQARMDRRQRMADWLGRQGVVHVVRDVGLKERIVGQVSLLCGEVDEDLEAYLRESEQIPSALGTELIFNNEGRIVAAGGVLLQTMPDSAKEAHVVLREAQHLLRSGGLYDLLAVSAQTPDAVSRFLLGLHGLGLIVHAETVLTFRCRCDKDRVASLLRGLSAADLDEMIADGKAEIECNFCSTKYQISRQELLDIRRSQPQPTVSN